MLVPEVSAMGAECQSLQCELVLVQKVLLSMFSQLWEIEVPPGHHLSQIVQAPGGHIRL